METPNTDSDTCACEHGSTHKMHDLVNLMTLVNVCSEFVESEAKNKRPNQPSQADAGLKRTKVEFDAEESQHLARETELNPIGGSSCHQCKSRRNAQDLTFCTSSLTKKSRGAQCRKKYCDHCLTKFYQDIPSPGTEKGWRCPSCRDMCCCAACRRREGASARLPLRTPMSTPTTHRTLAPRSRLPSEGRAPLPPVVRTSASAGSQSRNRHLTLTDIPDKALEGALLLTSLNPDAEPPRYFNGSFTAYNPPPQKPWPANKEASWSPVYDGETESDEEDGKVHQAGARRDSVSGWNCTFTPGYAFPAGHRRSSSMGPFPARRGDRYSECPSNVMYGYRGPAELHPPEISRLPHMLPSEVQDELLPSVVKRGQVGYVSPDRSSRHFEHVGLDGSPDRSRHQFEHVGLEDRHRAVHFPNDFEANPRLMSSRSSKCELLQRLEGHRSVVEATGNSSVLGTDQDDLKGSKYDSRSLVTQPAAKGATDRSVGETN